MSATWLRAFVTGACACASLVAVRPALAQGMFEGPASPFPNMENSPPNGKNPKLSERSFKLFDQFRSDIGHQIDIGPIWARKVQDESSAQGRRGFDRGAPLAGELAFGLVQTTPHKSLFIFGAQRTILRVVDDKSFSWSLLHQDIGAGVRIGPFAPEVSFGVDLLSADIFHARPSIQMLTPRATAGLGIHLGRFRIDARAHGEYLWRWFGPDYMIRGVTIGLRLDLEKPARNKDQPFPDTR